MHSLAVRWFRSIDRAKICVNHKQNKITVKLPNGYATVNKVDTCHPQKPQEKTKRKNNNKKTSQTKTTIQKQFGRFAF